MTSWPDRFQITFSTDGRLICLSRQRAIPPFFRLFIFRRQLHFLLFSKTPKTVCPTGERLQPFLPFPLLYTKCGLNFERAAALRKYNLSQGKKRGWRRRKGGRTVTRPTDVAFYPRAVRSTCKLSYLLFVCVFLQPFLLRLA